MDVHQRHLVDPFSGLALSPLRQVRRNLQVWLWTGFACIGLIFAASSATAAICDHGTCVSGSIDSNTTWTPGGSPYVLNGQVTVAIGKTLTIAPGVVVKAQSAVLQVNGTLIAQGQSQTPIVFTSLRDDGAGGDTNEDGERSVPSAGDWYGLQFASTSNGNVLDYVVVQYGGSCPSPPFCGNVATATSSLTLSNSRLSDSTTNGLRADNAAPIIASNIIERSNYGLYLNGSAAQVTGNRIRDNATGVGVFAGSNTPATLSANILTHNGDAFYVDSLSLGTLVNGNTLLDNSLNGIHIPAGTVGRSAQLGADVPYWLEGQVTVAAGTTLTLKPGVVVKGRYQAGWLQVNGTLIAQGTAATRIVFTSERDDSFGGDTSDDGARTWPLAGDWYGLQFTSTSSGNVLDHVVVRYGGRCGTACSNVYMATSGVTLSHSEITDSATYGVQVESGAPTTTITSSTIARNSYGLYLNGSAAQIDGNTISYNSFGLYAVNSSAPTVNGNTLTGNGTAIFLDASSARTMFGGNSVVDNAADGVHVAGGTLARDATWTADQPYVLDGQLSLAAGTTLTLAAGAVVKGRYQAGWLQVNGTLIAQGTGAARIVFTSERDDSARGDTNEDGVRTSPGPGDWYGLQFTSTSSGNVLDHVVVRYGGRCSTACSNVYMATSGVTLSHSEITDSAAYGVQVESGTPMITDTTISRNSYGLYLNGSAALISGNTISDNSVGLYAINSSAPTLINNAFGGNGTALSLDTSSAGTTLNGNTVVGGGTDGIHITGGTLSQDATWNADQPYVLDGQVTIAAGTTLTLEAGAVVKGGYQVGWLLVNGTLLAQGTAAAPVVFTSARDDSIGGDIYQDGARTLPRPGDWYGLQFTSTSSGNLLDHVVVRYGGRGGANVYMQASPVTLSNSEITDSASAGLQVESAAPTITNNRIERNPYGIYLSASGGLVLSQNTIAGNAAYGILNASSSATIDARNNYWLTPTGPYDPSDDRSTGGDYNPTGTGDTVTDLVKYRPFLNSDPNPRGAYSLAGRVYDAPTNAPLSHVTILLGPYSAQTDTSGRYVFSDLPYNAYTLRVAQAGYYTYSASLNLATASTRDLYLVPHVGSCPIGTLSGHMRDATTSAVKRNVALTVGGVATQADGNGHYSVAGLIPGVYRVGTSVPGYVAYSANVSICGDAQSDILLTKTQTVFGPHSQSGYGPDPVNTATGNYIHQHTDLQIPGKGVPLGFERNYNSQAPSGSQTLLDGPLGFGWNHTLNTSLSVDADHVVVIRWGDSHTETYTPNGSGGFTPQYGVFDTLTLNGNGTYTLTKKDLTQYRFNNSKRLAAMVDKNGNTIALAYTGALLTQITDTAGRVVTLSYDGSSHLTLLTDPIGRTVQFAYDGDGNLVSAIDPNGHTTTYTYDADHQLLTVTDPRGHVVVTNTYDDQQRVVTSQRDAKGGQTTYSYDTANNVTMITNALGGTTKDYHDALLRLIREDDASGHSALYAYDEAGNRTSVTDKNGNATTYEYDAHGNVTKKTDALSNVTAVTYDANNNPLNRTDALNQATTFTYDVHSNLITTTDPLSRVTAVAYNAAGLPLTVTDPRGHTTTNTYDALGNLTRVADALGNHTDYTYDGVGRRLTITDARGHTTTFTYDPNNNLLTTTDARGGVTTNTYDENNNRLSVTDPRGKTTTSTYDVKDLLSTTTDALGHAGSNTYDALDRKSALTDKNGHTTDFAYDPVGNLIATQDPLGNTTSFTYDGNGNRLTVHDPLGNVTSSAYDKLNRVTQVADPLGHVSSSAYDALGRVIATANAKVQNTEFVYDALGRLLQVTDAAGGTVAYSYDENGNRLSMTDPNGHTTMYSYDALNRLITMVEPLGNTTAYQYDAVGSLARKTDPNGHAIQYAYDELNRLTTVTYPDGSSVTFTYDANGNRTQMVDSVGTTTYTYDELNRMTQYADPFGKTVGYGYDFVSNRTTLTYPGANVVTYAYDAANRMTGVTDWLNQATSYSYDAASRLVLTTNPNGTTAAYAYDAASRLIALTNAKSDASVISSYAYTLDQIGNQLQVDQTEPLPPVFASRQTPYSYDTENHMTSVGGTTATFDNNGNMTARGSDSFVYDFENRLTQSTIGGATSQYRYDGRGNRLAKTVAGTTTRYVLDVNRQLTNVLAETDSVGAVVARYVYGLGLVARILPDGGELIYHYDSRGSVIGLTNAAGNVTDAYSYDPFGVPLAHAGATANPFTYVGRHGVMDDGNGLAYIRARYYTAESGRFLTKDPQAGNEREGQSLHRYVYAVNNPVRLIDISGFSPKSSIAAPSGSSDDWHDFLFSLSGRTLVNLRDSAIHEAFETYLIENLTDYLSNHGVMRAGEIAGSVKASADSAFIIKDILKGGYDELHDRGYSLADVGSGLWNIQSNIAFAANNHGAALNALTEGVDSATAVTINALSREATLGFIDPGFTGKEINSAANAFGVADWLGGRFYEWGWY
jgi:RHS repeat-associated protein